MAKEILDGVETESKNVGNFDPTLLLTRVRLGFGTALAEAGKIIAPHLDDDQVLELINLGASIAYFGKLKPDSCWEFDRRKARFLKKDASNFFDIAQPCIMQPQ